ncbi:MAG: hypothetical protein KME04_19990 [Pleurocapsa minor GSE-CHR-MK-17-07R]|nr:hypothetical protein [Pleurocapsa minor GSE-CHR-MK 17-07R]
MLRVLRGHWGAALAGYVLLAVVFTWPLVTQLSTHVMGASQLDNYEYVWKMWWVPHALFERGISPFFAPDIYVPFGYPLAYGEISPIHTFGQIPVTLLVGPIVSYNLAGLASFVLSGLAVYALACRWIGRTPGLTASPRMIACTCFFAGAAFAVCAWRLQKLTGHLPLFDTHWLALTVLALDVWLETRRLTHAMLLGLAFAAAALSSWYFAFMLGLLLPVYTLALQGNLLPLLRNRRTWLGIAVSGMIVVGLCGPFLLPYLQLDTEGATIVPLSDATFWAASFTDYLMPNPLHPLWGRAVQGVMWPFPTPMLTEFVISIGWVTLILGLAALKSAAGRQWRALKWLAAAAFVLSLGPVLTLSRLPLGLPLPAAFLREVMPFADSVRSWGRFSIFVMLAFALLAAAGLMVVTLRWPATRRRAAAVIALGLMLFGAWQGPLTLSEIRPRPVDLWLAQQPETSPIMEYPLGEALSGPAMYYTSIHGRPVTFGYGTYLPLLYRQRHPALTTFPADAALDQLAAWGVETILVSEWALSYDNSFTLAQVAAQPRLSLVTRLDEVAVYALDAGDN